MDKLTLEEFKNIAIERGGKCLSEKYINNSTKLKWQCADGHIWESTPARIKSGAWCPHCRMWITEEKCRFIFEKIFHHKFPKTKSIFDDHYIELDGYCEKLKMAFEYNGRQHYKKNDFFKAISFSRRQEIDRFKKVQCKKKGIQLIVIPYYKASTNQKLLNYISKKINIKITFNLSDFQPKQSRIKELKQIAKKRNGKLLSKYYHGSDELLLWQCEKKHIWKARSHRIKQGRWCPYCVGKYKTIKDMQNLAKRNGGKCLSLEYKGSSTKLKWECAEGHIWETTPNNIQAGYWCIICKGKKLTLNKAKEFASKHHGLCLATEYKNNSTKMKWGCKNGHTWSLSLNKMQSRVKRNKWCLLCEREVI